MTSPTLLASARRASLLVCLLLAACGGGGGGAADAGRDTPDASTPVEPQITSAQMIERAAATLCASVTRCCNEGDVDDFFARLLAAHADDAQLQALAAELPPRAPLAADACVATVTKALEIEPFGGWIAAEKAGQAAFVPARALACLSALEDARCGAPLAAALADTSCFGAGAAPASGRAMFAHTGAVGAACTIVADGEGSTGTCDAASAYCCVRDPEHPGCQPPHAGATGTCLALAASGEACSTSAPVVACAAGERCVAGKCRAETALKTGDSCVSEAGDVLGRCEQGFCDGTCQAARAAGEACSQGAACQSGVCVDGYCTEQLACSSATRQVGIVESPISASILTGHTQAFHAAVRGAFDKSVTWSVEEAESGTIGADGVFTAADHPGVVHVVATSTADTHVHARATVTVREVQVGITPETKTILAGGRQQFQASVTGDEDASVTWIVQEADGGSVSAQGLYTAPEKGGTFHLIATSNADPRKRAIATITVQELKIAVSPEAVPLITGASRRFTATVTGWSDTAVTWSVLEQDGGAITDDGLYTAPMQDGTFHVVATSVADPRKTASAEVVVTSVGVRVEPATATLLTSARTTLAATVTGWSDTQVRWDVQESEGGSVDENGVYTAPELAGTYHVVATSVADPTKSATAEITVRELQIALAPSTAILLTGGTKTFQAEVTGWSDTAYTWSVLEQAGGAITSEGAYTAPEAAGTYHVVATSVADPRKKAAAEIVVRELQVSVAPGTITLLTGAKKTFAATVSNWDDTAVTWTASGGTITSGGEYTAPDEAGTFHVVATSVADPRKTATATITVEFVAASVTPGSATILTDATQQLSASVSGTRDTSVTWSVTESNGGSVSASGLYTAPGAAGTYHVVATSVADPRRTATAAITVRELQIAVAPTTATILTNGTAQLAATVSNWDNAAVTWSVTESAGGSVDSSGLYTAPGAAGTYHVVATSVADPRKKASAAITVSDLQVAVAPTTATIFAGTTKQLAATVSNWSDARVTWSVAESDGGSVDSSGLYTAPEAAGTYHVVATSVADPRKSASAAIAVQLVGVSVSPATVTMNTGLTQTFTATVSGTSNTAVTWTASGGTITSAGVYTAPATAGTYTVTATSTADTRKSARATITVEDVQVAIAPATVTLLTNATQQFTATASGTSNSAVTWSVSSTSAGTIDASGLFTASSTAGTYTVTATSVADTRKKASATVTVNSLSVAISPTTATILTGSTKAFTATVSSWSDTSVTWSITESGGGSVDSSGVYTAPNTAGTYHVVATSVADPRKKATATVTVSDLQVAVSPTSVTMLTGNSQTFTATVSNWSANTSVTWSATGGTITTAGVFTAPTTAGTYTITATSAADPRKSASATVTVQLVAVSVSPATVTMNTGLTQTFTAAVSGTSNTSVTWTASGGTITSAGVYTAPATAGTYTVTATSAADTRRTATATITVESVQLSVSPASATILTGATQTLTATVTGTSNTAVTWTTTGGTITSAGVYTAPNAAGTYTVTATSVEDSRRTATASIVVRDLQVAISPTSATMLTGGSQTFTATVSNWSNTAVTWTASGGSITSAGVYTAPNAAGTYTVTATSVADTRKSATAAITVEDVQIAVSPESATILSSTAQSFAASVSGTSDTRVGWSVVEQNGGTITTSGVYTAPATAGTFHVVATSLRDSRRSATATVTVLNVLVGVTPATATIITSAQQAFSATVTGIADTRVVWSVTESAGGSVDSSGVYTAPDVAGTYHVVATSVADPRKSASAAVTVREVQVHVTPAAVTILDGAQQQFSADVTGTSDGSVTWSVVEDGGGSVDQNGLYTAPQAAGAYTVVATSVADPRKSASASVTVSAVQVSVSPSLVTLITGAQQQFSAIATGTSDPSVSWSVVEPNGGSITPDGVYTAPEVAGTYHVVATSNVDPRSAATATITVREVQIAIAPTTVALVTDQVQTFAATVSGWDDTSVVWSVQGAGAIDRHGNYAAPSVASSDVVTATSVADPRKTASAQVTVQLVDIAVSPASSTMLTGLSHTFTASVSGTSDSRVIWSVVEQNGGSISSSGVYTAPNTAGTFHVRATSVADPRRTATAAITVEDVQVAVSPSSATVLTGMTQSFGATVTGTSGDTSVTWSVQGTGSGSIDQNGLYTAPNTAGTYTVLATSNADSRKSATATVTVQLVGVSISPTTAAMITDSSRTFTATVTGTSNTAVTWTANGGSITSAGVYTAPATAGTYTVTATSQADSRRTATATITVSEVAVSVSPATLSTFTGLSRTFTASVTGSTNTAVTWTANGGSITSAGAYTAPSTAGTYTVTATSQADPRKSATATITVEDVQVAVSPTSATLFNGTSQTFSATVTGTSNTAVTWTASGGTITTAGVYTAPATAGTYTVTATSAADTRRTASATITVQAVTVTVSPASPTVAPSATQQFTATVTGVSDTSVTWSVLDSGGGTIDQSGLYTAPSTSGSYRVAATSNADPRRNAIVTVTVGTVQVANHVVISEFSGGNGTNSTDEFIELYNPTASDVAIGGWMVSYASYSATATSTTTRVAIPTGAVIRAHGFYLLGKASGYTPASGEPAADTTYTFDMAGPTNTNGGQIWLTTALGSTETLSSVTDPKVVDMVGWNLAVKYEGSGRATSFSSSTGTLERKAVASSTTTSMAAGGGDAARGNGSDTNDNSVDFVQRAARQPQSSVSPIEIP